MEQFNSKYDRDLRVLEVLQEGRYTITETAKYFNLSRRSIYMVIDRHITPEDKPLFMSKVRKY